MIKVALVGNIASGKSTVEITLKKLGYDVLDTDDVCHTLLGLFPDIPIAFAQYDVFDGEKISREKLGKLVFNNPKLKEKLEDILYPQVRVEIRKFFDTSDKNIVFVAIPLLFEAQMEDMFDKVLFVYSDDAIRLKRLMARNDYTEEYAKLRMESQVSQDVKLKKSDYIIYNNSTVEDLELSVKNVLEQIR
ncbi:MAG: dephospho-CoA kinase [Muribaculaceae bacterium]|nr:dephospho-CoA kinase [Muribaculaceae bacterium]